MNVISKGKFLLREFKNILASRRESPLHFLLISTETTIGRSQIFPFYFFREPLFLDLGVTFSEVNIEHYSKHGYKSTKDVSLIFFQPWWNQTEIEIEGVLRRIKREYPEAKIIFLDSFAPLDLRFAELVDPFVDLYIKKQVFRDRNQYGRSTIGDTNLVDYYGKLYGLDYKETTFNIPTDFLMKLVVGPGFGAGQTILPTVANKASTPTGLRSIDLHARLGGKGNDWYGMMRESSNRAAKQIENANVILGASVKHKQYLDEMSNSKMCFSPFGFGEVCWRDYEAVMCGALLIKPDMSHVETFPNIFQPFQSYIPIKWDFSDLTEKVNYYLNNPTERARITRNAYQILRDYAVLNGFIDHIRQILEKLQIDPDSKYDLHRPQGI
jgi:hypothetical protein